jgi:hypothetical protein
MTKSKGTTHNPVTHTLEFTQSEANRINKAAKICGWKAGEGDLFARQLLLRNVASILGGERRKTRGRKASAQGGKRG